MSQGFGQDGHRFEGREVFLSHRLSFSVLSPECLGYKEFSPLWDGSLMSPTITQLSISLIYTNPTVPAPDDVLYGLTLSVRSSAFSIPGGIPGVTLTHSSRAQS